MMILTSLMIGASSATVSDMFRDAGASNSDFTPTTRGYQITPAVISDFDVDGKFTDESSPSPIPVEVHHSAYAWDTAPYKKFIIVKYIPRIKPVLLLLENCSIKISNESIIIPLKTKYKIKSGTIIPLLL